MKKTSYQRQKDRINELLKDIRTIVCDNSFEAEALRVRYRMHFDAIDMTMYDDVKIERHGEFNGIYPAMIPLEFENPSDSFSKMCKDFKEAYNRLELKTQPSCKRNELPNLPY